MSDTPPAPSSIPEGHLEIGHIRRAHGLRGEVFVQLITDNPARVAPGAHLRTVDRELTVESARVASNGRHVVKFAEIPDRTAAERFANVALFAPPIDDPDALWVHELIGSEVREVDGTSRGRCVSVIANPASDILELESGALGAHRVRGVEPGRRHHRRRARRPLRPGLTGTRR